MKLAWRTSLAVLGLVAGTLNVLAARKILGLSTTQQVIIIVLLGALTFLDNTRLAVKRYREPGEERRQLRVHKALLSMLITLAEDSNVRVSHLGSSIFVERRRGLRFWEKTLDRRARVRISESPHESKIDWQKGKGVVGTAWKTGHAVHRPRRRVAEKYGGGEVTDAQWQQASEKAKANFTRSEFQSMVGKYAEVLAVPIKGEGEKLLAIVSVDLTVDSPDTGREVLAGRDIASFVTASTSVLRDDLTRL